MTAAPFRPAELAPADVAFANAVCGRRRRIAVALGGAEQQLRFLAAARTGSGPAFRLSDGVRNAWLRWADWDALPPIAELCGGAFAALPEELQALVAEAALAPLLDALGAETGSAWRMDAAEPPPTAGVHEVAFELRAAGGGASRRGDLALDAAAAAAFPELLRRAPPLPWRSLDAVPLAARLLLGETRIPRADLAALRPHDVAIVERLYYPADAAAPTQFLAAIGAALAFEARVADGRATIGPPAALPADADEPLVRFELPAAPLALGAARALRAGSILPFDAAAGVALTLAGRRLATGALVRCGDRFGVRLH